MKKKTCIMIVCSSLCFAMESLWSLDLFFYVFVEILSLIINESLKEKGVMKQKIVQIFKLYLILFENFGSYFIP